MQKSASLSLHPPDLVPFASIRPDLCSVASISVAPHLAAFATSYHHGGAPTYVRTYIHAYIRVRGLVALRNGVAAPGR